MAKKHDISMIATWARENGIKGFDHLDPKIREQQKQWAIKRSNEYNRDKNYESKKH